MATYKINIENGKFTTSNGKYEHHLSEHRFVANGWIGVINDDGSIVLEASRCYSDGESTIRVTINSNGYHKVTTKFGDDDIVHTVKKGFLVRKGEPLNGTFGLPGGNIKARYFYYRSNDFNKFLEEHGLTAVSRENPNAVFNIRNARYGGGECHMKLLTDGHCKDVGYDTGRSDHWEEICPNTSASEVNELIRVTDASWVIKCQYENECGRHNYSVILLTEKDPKEITNLPNIKRSDFC